MTVLLLPGMNMNRTIFGGLSDEGIALDFTDFHPDSELWPEGASGMAAYADRLENFLDKSAEWNATSQRIVVGHSFGGMLALWWLLHRRSDLSSIQGLVLVGTTSGPVYENAAARIGAGGLSIRLPLSGLIKIANRPLMIRAGKRLVRAGRIDSRFVDFRTLRNRGDWWVGLQGWRNTDWRSITAHRQTMADFDVSDRLNGIDCRTEILHGARDSVLPEALAEEMDAAIPDSRLKIISDAGHALPLTHWREVQAAIQRLTEPAP